MRCSDWNLDGIPGWDRNHELAPVAFFASDQSTAGPLLLSPANFTSASWRRHVRCQLRWRLHTGMTVPKEGWISIILHVTAKGM